MSGIAGSYYARQNLSNKRERTLETLDICCLKSGAKTLRKNSKVRTLYEKI